MPTEEMFNRDVLITTTTSRRWSGLTRFETDVATLRTWDVTLSRLKRILVPIDLQAYVVNGSSESVVGLAGRSDDPAPFSDGTELAAGVHLHWAMPDALMHGVASEDGNDLELPDLPDRFVVVRALLPKGSRAARTDGWVIDTASLTVTPLTEWGGGQRDAAVSAPTAASGGSLMWGATYHGSVGRHSLHDPLSDVDFGALTVARASYTVAGWWSRTDEDPLTGGPWSLLERLAERSWGLTPDGEARLNEDADPRELQLQSMSGATSSSDRTRTTTIGQYSLGRNTYEDFAPRVGVPFEAISEVLVAPSPTRYATLLHGSVVGVPLTDVPTVDEAPRTAALAASLGLDVDDIAAAFAAPSLGTSDEDRLTGERLLAAFTGNLLEELGQPDGLDSLEDREHSDTFDSAPGPPLPSARPDVVREDDALSRGPLSVGRKGRTAAAGPAITARTTVERRRTRTGKVMGWQGLRDGSHQQPATAVRRFDEPKVKPTASSGAVGREKVRPAPRIFRPAAPMVGIRGAKPHPRHHGDGLYDDAGILRCRYPGEAIPEIDGTVSGALILPSLGSGSIPPEVVGVVREAILLDPWADGWLAGASGRADAELPAVIARLGAERVRVLGGSGTYDPSGRFAIAESRVRENGPRARASNLFHDLHSPAMTAAASELARHAFLPGTPPSPVGFTVWRQPWVPIFVEWDVTVRGSTTLKGWELTGRDLTGGPAPTLERRSTGRSPLARGVGKALTDGIARWLQTENERDLASPNSSVLSDPDESVLEALSELLEPLEVMSCSLDGVRENLLGIDFQSLLTMTADDETSDVLPRADQPPIPLFGGTLTVNALRIVDAFGRVRGVTVDQVATTLAREVEGEPATITLPPRLQHGGRWLLRLIDPAHPIGSDIAAAPEAFVNQVDPTLTVNPVSGFLLPDHIDETLEVFDAQGNPLGEVGHDPLTGGVEWVPAPGRPLPPDAAPTDGAPPTATHVALLAMGLVTSDVQTRHAASPPTESTLTALLRAIDTTLHTVDAYAGVGAPTIAGLVGRPLAVVRASIRFDAPDDLAGVEVTSPGGEAERREAFAALSTESLQFRLGDLGRSDDSALGFFVDDDYSHFHVVDKAVASAARQAGAHRGQLGLLGQTVVPDEDPLDHPYLVLEDTLTIRVGQVRSLTIIMLPAGRVHLTSGIAPRKALALSEDWVSPGLRRMSPSVRLGPVLVDPAAIRLPTVSTLPQDQVFTRRTGGLSWRDDPITAATSAALLPPMPHEVQEGWIRVAPQEESP
ncbi:hypothetical protein GCM10022199_01510 [Marihabitans asiaticum]|uniref:Uncharacterized protein n=1 Tax=Marihabitans asiaticum TaxID=415218 RepID=A0A560WFV0_9MICO|nr:hypothetical protein [Marihabitans asiaticum]TWD16572.1 hypothetical protein FB557_0096 [Marihabitans asiaticum]